MSCTKSKEVHPELGDSNDEIVTVGVKDVHVKYLRTDHSELSRVVFHYSPADANGDAQQFEAAEMTKKDAFFELTLNDLLSDTLYWYYYELFLKNGDVSNTTQKAFRTQVYDDPEPPAVELPTVSTGEVSEITANSAQCGVEVTNDGGAEVTECGICWSEKANPSLNDSYAVAGAGVGAFTAVMNDLEANTTYHVRAYAVNEAGVAYGVDKEFVTLDVIPDGIIDGLFTVNDNGDKVRFSQGNLQYQASTNTWRLAEHQWDYVGDALCGTVFENGVGCNNALISSTYDGWIDLFGWATSGYDHGAMCYQPWSCSSSSGDYFAYGLPNNSLFDQTGQADWGYNAISNGGDLEGLWHTLTRDEFVYIVNFRNTLSGVRYAKAQVNDVPGIILLPDDWNTSVYTLNETDIESASYSSNTISDSEWMSVFEPNGAVFMPVTCQRPGLSCTKQGCGLYWLGTCTAGGSAYNIYFHENGLVPDDDCGDRDLYIGRAVRLVQEANP